MAKAPSFMWYPKDCDTDEDVRLMTDQEFGFYVRMLNHAWMNDGVPAETADIARALGRPKQYVERMMNGRVGRKWVVPVPFNGRLINLKQEEQRNSGSSYSESRRRAASVRWFKEHLKSCKDPDCKHDAHAYANAVQADMQMQMLPIANANARANAKENPKNKNSLLDDFGKFEQACRDVELPFSAKDLAISRDVWKRLDYEQKLKAIKGLYERRDAGEFLDPAFRPLPQNYLDRVFERPVRPQPQDRPRKTRTEEMIDRA